MICPNCDKEIETGIDQCPYCGCHFPMSAKQKCEEKERQKKLKQERRTAEIEEQKRLEKKKQAELERIKSEQKLREEDEKKQKTEEDNTRKEEVIQNTSKQEEADVLCPNCGKKLNSDARFCRWCGKSLSNKEICPKIPSEMLSCPNCGKELKPTAIFCNRCGHKITKE